MFYFNDTATTEIYTYGHTLALHDDLPIWDVLDLADGLLAHVEAADEVRGHADMAEQREDVLGNTVVEHALAGDRALFLGVERGRVVLEILDQRAGFRPLVEDLGLALVDLAAACHLKIGRAHV